MERFQPATERGDAPAVSDMTFEELNTSGWNAFLGSDEATLIAIREEVSQRIQRGADDPRYQSLATSLERDLDRLSSRGV